MPRSRRARDALAARCDRTINVVDGVLASM
jgi:hypothetical protein